MKDDELIRRLDEIKDLASRSRSNASSADNTGCMILVIVVLLFLKSCLSHA